VHLLAILYLVFEIFLDAALDLVTRVLGVISLVLVALVVDFVSFFLLYSW